MNDFFEYFEGVIRTFPLHLSVYYSKTMDWVIQIYKKGCADDYPQSLRNGDDAIVVEETDVCMKHCFAKAYVSLMTWLKDNTGGC